MSEQFKITGPGKYKCRDGSLVDIIYDPPGPGSSRQWYALHRSCLYGDNGRYLIHVDEDDAWDIVELVELVAPAQELGEQYRIHVAPAATHNNRLVIAAQILAGMCANPNSFDKDTMICDAVSMADDLIEKCK